MKKTLKIILCIVICSLVGYLSGLVTQTSLTTWYPQIEKPSFNPPNYIFPIVWPALFILMGIAVALIWDQLTIKKNSVTKGLILFSIQLLLNALWSILFFGMKNPKIAFFELILLLITVILTSYQFYKIKPIASYLMIPYILWLSFAGILNYTIWILNS